MGFWIYKIIEMKNIEKNSGRTKIDIKGKQVHILSPKYEKISHQSMSESNFSYSFCENTSISWSQFYPFSKIAHTFDKNY